MVQRRSRVVPLSQNTQTINHHLVVYCFFFEVTSIKRGAARQIDEYVHTMVPNMSASVNPRMDSGPKKNIAINTNTTVRDVNIDRRIVPCIELSIIRANSNFFDFPSWRFERMRSIITIESLIEYQSTVSIAVIKNVSILNSGKKNDVTTYRPKATTTSCKSDILVTKANAQLDTPGIDPQKAYII